MNKRRETIKSLNKDFNKIKNFQNSVILLTI